MARSRGRSSTRRVRYGVARPDGHRRPERGNRLVERPDVDFADLQPVRYAADQAPDVQVLARWAAAKGRGRVKCSSFANPEAGPSPRHHHRARPLSARHRLKARPGKDICCSGAATVRACSMPVSWTAWMSAHPVLGGGIPLLPSPAARARLKLTKQRVTKSGFWGWSADGTRRIACATIALTTTGTK